VFDQAPPVDETPAERPILPLERVAAGLEVFLCCGFPSQVMVMWMLAGFGMQLVTPDMLPTARAIIFVSLIDSMVVIGLVLMFLRAHHESPRDVLIGRRPVLREIGLGILLIPVIFVLVALVLGLVLHYAPSLRNVPENPLAKMLTTRREAIVFAFVVLIAGGVREEVQRGFIIHRFDGYLGGGTVGVIVWSVLFGLGHYVQGWDASIATGCLGLTWAIVYLRRRSIVAPLVSHASFNVAQVIARAVALP
jgi:uncharacterized protein